MARCRSLLVLLGFCVALGEPGAATAVPLFSVGINTAVTAYDRIATFDSVVSGETDLRDYHEGGLRFFANGVAFVTGRPGMIGGHFYPNAGSNTYTAISTDDDIPFRAIEFNADGSGLDNLTYVYWETYRHDLRTGFGSATIWQGSFVGLVDPDGIDEVRIAAYSSPDAIADRSDFSDAINAVAIDTVRVALPEPSAGALADCCFGALWIRWAVRLRPVRETR